MAVLKTALIANFKKLQHWSFFMPEIFKLKAGGTDIKKPKTVLGLSNNNF